MPKGASMANNYRLYNYRWVVLAVFMFINLTIQMNRHLLESPA